MSTIEIRGRSEYVRANGLRQHVLRYDAATGTRDADGRGTGTRDADPRDTGPRDTGPRDTGPRDTDGRDLLILPGITSPAVTADFFAAPLADLGFRVTVADARGRGETDRARPGQYRLQDYAADVAALVGALGLRAPAVLGHSMGARIAAAYACRHAPRDHGLLVLVDPPVSGPGRGPYPTSRESFIQQLREARRGTTPDEVRRFYPGWPLRELRLRAEVLASCDETAVLESHAGLENEDFFGYWERLERPVLLVRGQDSPVVPEPAADDLRRVRPDIPVVSVPGAGHMVPWDNLPGFLDAVRRPLQAERELT